MATYYYDMPVIVKYFGNSEEDEELLPVKPGVVDRVVESFNGDDLKQYSHDIQYEELTATANGKKVRVTAKVSGRYSKDIEEKIRKFLIGQCSDGWNENGIELSGYLYGYSQKNIIAYTWDYSKIGEFDVQTVRGAARTSAPLQR